VLVQVLDFSRAAGVLWTSQHISSSRGARYYLCELTLFATHHEASLQASSGRTREWAVSRQILHFLIADLPNIRLIDIMICSDMATNAAINTCQSSVIICRYLTTRIARQGSSATD
jgi:hypothetical protein